MLRNIVNLVQSVPGRYLPSSMPSRYRRNYAREMLAWCLLPVMLGMLEGGVVGFTVKKSFGGQVDPDLLNLAVGLLTGLPAIANLTSFAWAALAHGRNKIRFIVALQVLTGLCIGLIGFASPTTTGFAIFVVAVAVGRIAWAGVITIRTVVWANNYPRSDRARVAGCFATVQALGLSGITFLVGFLLDENSQAYRWVFPVAAIFGLIGSACYGRVRVRRHQQLISSERDHHHSNGQSRPTLNPLSMITVLRQDHRFSAYMICMFLIGTGNLMIAAPLIIVLDESFNLDYVEAISILTSIPILMMPLSIPIWSRLLDRVHVVRFRSFHSWVFVSANVVLFGSVWWLWMPGIWIAAVIRGIGFGGGVLAWNLGHHDFAKPDVSSQYMGIHVTLTGLRGLLAPLLGVKVYEWLVAAGFSTGSGVFLLSALLAAAGGIGFLRLRSRVDFPAGTEGLDRTN